MQESNLDQNPVVNIQPQNNIPQPPPAEVRLPSSKSKLPIILIIFLFIIILAGGGYIFFGNKLFPQKLACKAILRICNDGSTAKFGPNCQQSCPEDSISPAPTLSSDTTANWKTYTNTKLGFKLKYPLEYTIEEEGESEVSFSGLFSETQKAPRSLVITTKLTDLSKIKTCEESNWDPKILCFTGKTENTNLDDRPAIAFGLMYPGGGFGTTTRIQTINDPKIEIYATIYGGGGGTRFDQILSTFKFTPASPAGGDQNQQAPTSLEINGFPVFPGATFVKKETTAPCTGKESGFTDCGSTTYTWASDNADKVYDWYTKDQANSGWKMSGGAGSFDDLQNYNGKITLKKANLTYGLGLGAKNNNVTFTLVIPNKVQL